MLRGEIQSLRKRGAAVSRRVLSEFRRLQAKIRSTGISPADGTQLASVSALSAPIFDIDGRIVAAVTSLGPRGEFDCSTSGAPAQVLLTVTRELSAALGHTGKRSSA
jgi:DNA-binding IclR family transcriptional regulator